MNDRHDIWAAGESYERYMGRWSRRIAAQFVDWLAPPAGKDWLEIGCGSGALTAAILELCAPAAILATDQSEAFVRHASRGLRDARARFATADALALPAGDATMDFVASGLVLNFIPDRVAALREMKRVLRPGGQIAFYVWDYPGGGMGFIDAFWRVAARCDPAAAALYEASRFPFCTEQGLKALCGEAALRNVDVATLESETRFEDFEAFWTPFTLGAGPAPGYCVSLDEAARMRLKEALRDALGSEGAIVLPARAWAVKALAA